ncbi:MAG: 2-octaprenyl-6-methoxyphenyl hydroxylase, partial [Halioglobus sp.]|nr:2-octaprenyl-6-methoxyphenyl hydroxylase [Halioglobus sp.]
MNGYSDIVIAGGGMVGISAALQLGAALPREMTICLIEGFPLPREDADSEPEYHPSFDARSTALAYSSRLIYEQLGVWRDLECGACPIERIHVSSAGRFGSTVL